MPLGVYPRKPFVDRLLDKLTFGDGCWEWQAALKDNGYGVIGRDFRTIRAHRAMYELFVGDIPEGKELDHLCRNRKCARPGHLEPVTRKENCARSPLIGRWSRAVRAG